MNKIYHRVTTVTVHGLTNMNDFEQGDTEARARVLFNERKASTDVFVGMFRREISRDAVTGMTDFGEWQFIA